MLVLSRKRDERIVIQVNGEVVVLTIVEVQSDKVRIGFEAAPHVAIDRQEVYESKLRNPPRNAA